MGGAGVVAATLVVPRVGAWYADLDLDDAAGPGEGEPVTITTQAGAAWVGTVRRAGVYNATRRLRVVGGADGLGRPAPPKGFRQVSLRTVLTDTLGAVGEALAPSSDRAALVSRVAQYARCADPASSVVGYWAARQGLAWRVLPSGQVWLGNGQGAPAPADYVLVDASPEARRLVLALDTFDVLPGHVIEGRVVDSVIYRLEGDRARAEVLHA